MSDDYIEFKGCDIAIMICSKCNTECRHCYVKYNGDIEPNYLYELLLHWKDKYNIDLNGTEILLNKNYLKSFKLINQDTIQTNGLVLYEKPELFYEMKKNGVKNISVSYHFQSHSMFSTVPKEIIAKVIEEANKYGMKVSINCTITPYSFDKVFINCASAHEMGARRIHFTNYLSTGKNNNIGVSCCIDDIQKREFFRQINEARRLYNPKELFVSRCGTFEHDNYSFKDNFSCELYRWGCAISPDMKVYPCIFMVGDPECEIGFVKDKKIFVKKGLCTKGKDKCLVYQKYHE